MDSKIKWSSPAAEKRAVRNIARLKCCDVHDFDWRGAVQRERARRQEREERCGVTVGIRSIVWCRCKKCGGQVLVEYAMPYMDGVQAIKKLLPD